MDDYRFLQNLIPLFKNILVESYMYELQAVCATAKDMTANFINIGMF